MVSLYSLPYTSAFCSSRSHFIRKKIVIARYARVRTHRDSNRKTKGNTTLFILYAEVYGKEYSQTI